MATLPVDIGCKPVPRTPSPGKEREEVLDGGCLTPGVVRVGDTVRRPSSGASGFTARLLRHLEAVGFTGAPRYLGQDERGRDVFSYIDGWVPAKFQQFADGQVADAGRLLKAFHDATRASVLVSGEAVICHHDAGPNNVVFQNGRPVAFIDFDMAAPGPALDDLGYMAWTWCVSSKAGRPPASEQARQVRLLADAYVLQEDEREQLLDAMLERQRRNVRFWMDRRAAGDGMHPISAAQIVDRIEWSKRELAYTEFNGPVFLQALR